MAWNLSVEPMCSFLAAGSQPPQQAAESPQWEDSQVPWSSTSRARTGGPGWSPVLDDESLLDPAVADRHVSAFRCVLVALVPCLFDLDHPGLKVGVGLLQGCLAVLEVGLVDSQGSFGEGDVEGKQEAESGDDEGCDGHAVDPTSVEYVVGEVAVNSGEVEAPACGG